MTTNLRIMNPIHQIVSQKIQPLNLETLETSYEEIELTLFEDQRFGIDTTLEIYFKTDPNGKEIKKVKAHVWNVYDGLECEDVEMTDSDRKELEKYLSQNQIINLQ